MIIWPNPCTESLASKNWIFSFLFILGSHNNYPWWIGGSHQYGVIVWGNWLGQAITFSGSTFSGISDVGWGTRPKGRTSTRHWQSLGKPKFIHHGNWKSAITMEALKGKWCIHGGFSSAMFDDRRVSYSTCAYEILSGHARINPLFQRRINVASDARQRLRNSVRQHWLWLSVSSKTRPGVH